MAKRALMKSNKFAVSYASRETALNTYEAPDLLLTPKNAILFKPEPKRQTDKEKDLMNGSEFAKVIYDMGQFASASLEFPMLQTHEALFLLAYGMGGLVVSALGTPTKAYQHTLTLLSEHLDQYRSLPSFTALSQIGHFDKRVMYGNLIDSFTFKYTLGEWLSATANVKSTGKQEWNIVDETVSALPTATTLTLAANGVYGSTDDERLDAVQKVMVELTAGVWTEVTVTAVSADTPAEITIEPPGAGASNVSYRVFYQIAEGVGSHFTFPTAKYAETALKMSDVTAKLYGKWDGSAIQGGIPINCEGKSFEIGVANNIKQDYCFGQTADYAGKMIREDRTPTLKYDRDFIDAVLEAGMKANDSFAFHIKATGAVFDTPYAYTLEFIFPKVGFKDVQHAADGKNISESVEFMPLEDDTYGLMIAKVTLQNVAVVAAE